MREFVYEPTGSVVRHHDGAQVTVDMADVLRTQENAVDEAEWIGKTLEFISDDIHRTLELFVDLGRITQTSISETLEQVYRRKIEESQIVERMAIVGDAFMFGMVIDILSGITAHRDAVKFFLQVPEAKDWLGW